MAMATSPQSNTELYARKGDLISRLPANVKERILELLSTRDAAKTALLSTHWNHVWLRHGRLVFDTDFFQCVSSKGKADKVIALVNIIKNILLLRGGRIKKFALHINETDPKPQQSDLDRWCRFLSRNGVQELTLSVWSGKYKLPSCIVSCRTIKRLRLYGFILDLPINPRCIFPGVTLLVFDCVEFDNVNAIVYSIPNLEKLAFRFCGGFSDLEFSAPNLLRLMVILGDTYEVGSKWFWLHPKAIMTTLGLCCEFLKYEDVVATLTFPTTASNLQVMKLYRFSFSRGELWVTMQLLQKSPKLCELGITISNFKCPLEIEAASRLLEYPKGYIASQDLKVLNTIKIESFGGSTVELLFVKMLLSRSPALESVIIQEHYDNDAMAVKVHRELLCFPRASPKAQIICMGQKHMNNLVCLPEF